VFKKTSAAIRNNYLTIAEIVSTLAALSGESNVTVART